MRCRRGSSTSSRCAMPSPTRTRGEASNALGLILFELVTLERAMEGSTLREVMANALAGRKRSVAAHRAGLFVPRDLAAIIEKATARDPDARYASVLDFAADLRRFLRGEE